MSKRYLTAIIVVIAVTGGNQNDPATCSRQWKAEPEERNEIKRE